MKIHKTVLAVVAAGGVMLGTVPAASAQTTGGSTADGRWHYDDGADKFCVTAAGPGSGHEGVSARLYPVTAGRGPIRTLSAAPGQKKCTSLATAYEDTAYRLVLSGSKQTRKFSFYS